MLSDFKSRCPSMAPLLQPQRRRFLMGGLGVVLLIFGIVLLTFLLSSSEDGEFVLQRTPLFAGRNNLPKNLFTLWGGNLSLVDLYSDLRNTSVNSNCTWCNTDIPRLRRGQVSSQFWVAEAGCFNGTEISATFSQLDIIDRIIKKYPSDFQLIKDSNGLKDVFDKKKLGSIVAVDGGESMMDSIALLRIFYGLGVRAFTLSNKCTLKLENGTKMNVVELEMIVREMNNLGMMIDIQGLEPNSQKKVLNVSAAPVMISHTAAAALYYYEGNTNDQIMELLKSKDGLLMITFDTPNLGAEDYITKTDVIKHINYIVDKIGFDNIAVGGNYDSMIQKPAGLEDVSDFPKLFKELHDTNSSKWTADNLDKLAGNNFARFFRNVECVRNFTKILETE